LEPERRAALRILVVEDERLARRAMRQILESDGYTVRVAASGHRAVEAMTAFDPHLVVMDWNVPGLSGERLCGEIRRKDPAVPIIVVSSSEEAFASHVEISARFRKPLDIRRFRTAVASRLAGRAG
jgi:DNA-binding response OmpR family regulator